MAAVKFSLILYARGRDTACNNSSAWSQVYRLAPPRGYLHARLASVWTKVLVVLVEEDLLDGIDVVTRTRHKPEDVLPK